MKKNRLVLGILWMGMLLGVGLWEVMPASAATITVINLDDSGPGSLRDAINIALSGDTITFDAGLDGGTIYLQSTLATNKSLIINGTANHIFLSGDSDNNGSPDVRVFHFTGGTTTLTDLTIMKGAHFDTCVLAGGCGGGIKIENANITIQSSDIISNTAGNGAGIFVQGSSQTTISMSKIAGNHALNSAGAIHYYITNSGHLITDSEIAHNTADGFAGAFYILGGSTVMQSSYIHHNGAPGPGGAMIISWGASTTIQNSTLEANTVPTSGVTQGGAIFNYGHLNVSGSTFSNNAAGLGGGIYNQFAVSVTPVVTVTNSTFTANEARDGAALFRQNGLIHVNNVTMNENVILASGGGTVRGDAGITLNHTIVANTVNGSDCAGTIASVGYNLVSDTSCNFASVGDMNNENPDLSPLGSYESNTQSFLLLPWSPALDGGDNALCQNFDQRGKIRPYNGDGDITTVCDVGAIENQPCEMPAAVQFSTQISRNGTDVEIVILPNSAGNDWYEVWTVTDPYVHPDTLILNNFEANIVTQPFYAHINGAGNGMPDFYLVRSVANCGSPGTRVKRMGEFSFAIIPGTP